MMIHVFRLELLQSDCVLSIVFIMTKQPRNAKYLLAKSLKVQYSYKALTTTQFNTLYSVFY